MKEDTFCVLPFTHLATHPNGDVTPCCESKLYPKNGSQQLNLNTDTIEDIRNSESFVKLREDLKNGIKSSVCDFCWKAEKDGLESKRIRENLRFGVNSITKPYFLKNMPLLNVELRLGNICNAKCVICNPGSSSKWNEDVIVFRNENDYNFSNYKHKIVHKKEWYRSDKTYDDISNQKMLKHLWFNGGEPTLIKEHYLFLQKLIDNGSSKTITLEYNVNGSHMPDELIELWKQFFHVYITISLDDIGDRLYYSRFPTNFDVVDKNIRKLESFGLTYTLIPTVSLLNVFNIVEIYEYFDKNYPKGNDPGLNFVKHPNFLAVSNLSDSHKELLLKKIENADLPELWSSFLKYHINEDRKVGYGPFIKYINKLDTHRNLDIRKYLPEFVELFSQENII